VTIARYIARERPLDPVRTFLASTAAANLADGLYVVMVPLLAVQLTTTPALVAGVSVAMTLPWLIFGLHAGVIADRVDRRVLILSSHAVRAFALGAAAVAWFAGAFDILMLYALAVVLGVTETLADSAAAAVPPALIGKDRLARTNSILVATQTVTNSFVGPALAGVLVAISAAAALGASASLYVLAAVGVALLAGTFRAERPAGRGLWSESVEGIALLFRDPTLRPLTLATAAMNVLWGGWMATFVLFAVDPGPLELPASGYALLMAGFGVGGVLGSVAAPILRDRIGLAPALTVDVVGTAAMFALPLTGNPALAAIGITLAGIGSAVWVVLNATVRQTIVPDHLLSRVYGAHRLVSWGALPIGAALGALAVETLGVEGSYALGAIVGAALLVPWTVWVIRRRMALV
jgi:MFS family permease